ncbi:hypothetical protein HZC00_00220 [Candidatus Kaiserbacteria bacterium]|nr:hypothetical protein [Candidatus Kaiserbacteria bacterium]
MGKRQVLALATSAIFTLPFVASAAVRIISPAASSTVIGSITITATTSGSNPVLGVQFYLDGSKRGPEDPSNPYSVYHAPFNTASTTNGWHALNAVARDGAGNYATSTTVNVKVTNTIKVVVNGADFGAVPDAVAVDNTSSGTTVTGTDSTSAIQAALDYALQKGFKVVCLPDGAYKTTDTLHMSYGGGAAQYSGLELTACSRVPHIHTAPRVTIYPTATDRPAISVQGGRNARISGIALRGQNAVWVQQQRAATNSFSSSPADWVDPALRPSGTNPGGIQKHAPYAGITIDAYKGTQPVDHYPTVAYPAWTKITTQYGKGVSSNTVIEDVSISGFGVGIAGSPNGDGNGDFIRIRNSSFAYGVYGVVIANGQSRNVELRDIQFDYLHTFFTNTRFGVGTGELAGPITNVRGGNGYQVFDLLLSFSGPLVIRNLSVTNEVRLGYGQGGGSTPSAITFEGCQLDFDGTSTHHTLPSVLWDQSGRASITFRNCALTTSPRMTNLVSNAPEITVDGGTITAGRYISGMRGSDAYRRALNYTGGVVIGGGTALQPIVSTLLPLIRVGAPVAGVFVGVGPAYAVSTQQLSANLQFAGMSRMPLTQWATGFIDTSGKAWTFEQVPNSQLITLANAAYAPVAPAVSGDMLTFQYAASINTSRPIHAGDILFHIPSGTLFIVTLVGAPDPAHAGALPITARQMNNMKINSDGSFAAQLLTDTSLSGYTELIDTSRDMPRQVEYGDFTTGSTAVKNVSRWDNVGNDITQYLSPGDGLLGYAWNDAYLNWPVLSGNAIQSITNGSSSLITLSKPARRTGRFPIYPVPIGEGDASARAAVPVASSPDAFTEPPVDTDKPVNAFDFGAVGDAVIQDNYATGKSTVTGTDNTRAIQSAIDYALQNGLSTVCLPDGAYKTTDTIQLGYGAGTKPISHISLIACSRGSTPYAGSAPFAGVTLYPTATDRPAINVQGGRNVRISGILIRGLNFLWIFNHRLIGFSFSANPADWLDPALTPSGTNPGGLQVHAPYAAITIDAYAGAQPADHYPIVQYPAWTGIGAVQYGKNRTSGLTVENVKIQGFGVGIMGSPSTVGTDPGYLTIIDSDILYGVYGVAVVNAQSPVVLLRNMDFAILHTFLTNRTFGSAEGVISGPVDNASGGEGYQVFDLNVTNTSPLRVSNLYVENQIRLGNNWGGTSSDSAVIFEGGILQLDTLGAANTIPSELWYQAGPRAQVVFRQSVLNASSRIVTLVNGTGRLVFDGGTIIASRTFTGANGSNAYRRAVNYTGGVLAGGWQALQASSSSVSTAQIGARVLGTYISAGPDYKWGTQLLSADLNLTTARGSLTQWASGFVDTMGKPWIFQQYDAPLLTLSSASVLPSFSGDMLTFEYVPNASWKFHPGDILYHRNSRTSFVVTLVGAPDPAHAGALPITARQMNNMKINSDGSFAAQLLTDTSLSGYTELIDTSRDMPRQVEYGDFTTGSTNIANVSRGDGYAADIATHLAPGDAVASGDSFVSSVTAGSPGSVTLTTPSTRSGRFPIFPLIIK